MISTIIYTASALFLFLQSSSACSRVNYDSGPEDNHRIVVGRTMDWLEDTNSSIWILPAGIERDGHAGANSLKWKSKYGSVVTTMYDTASVDGMNSQGLASALLYLAESDYGVRNSSRRGLSLGLWPQYFLDNFATVAEAKASLYAADGSEAFQIATMEVVKGVPSLGHVAVTDPSGDSLIMEYTDGKLAVYHSRDFRVMTNEPPYPEQLALDNYWRTAEMERLPGTSSPADRFARLAHYSRVVSDSKDENEALQTVAGMVRAVSVPRQPSSIEEPNNSPTRWRTYCDTRELKYYYESALDPSFFWVDLNSVELGDGSEVRMLGLRAEWTERLGDVSAKFTPTEAFRPMDVEDEVVGQRDEL